MSSFCKDAVIVCQRLLRVIKITRHENYCYIIKERLVAVYSCHFNISLLLWYLLSTHDRLDDKDSVDFHDNPPLPDNVVKEEDNTVRHASRDRRGLLIKLLQKEK